MIFSHLSPVRRAVLGSGLALVTAYAPAGAQAPATTPGTVVWTLSGSPVASGQRTTLVLRGVVRDGWHAYGLKQLDTGPTPLRVTLDTNPVATAAGGVVGSAPIVAHDPAFNLDTPYYTHGFSVTIPVRIKPHTAAGRQQVPVTVRFQTCNGLTCEPPKTLHLSAAVDIKADR